MFSRVYAKSSVNRCRLVQFAALLFAIAMSASPARAAFHLNGIEELYTNSSGTLQYIQFFSSFSGQNFTAGQQIRVTNTANTLFHTYTIPSNLPGATANKHWFIGTADVHAAGAPTPDFIMPDNFLFQSGGSISFFGSNSGLYSALPTDGNLARAFGTNSNFQNIAENFAGQTGLVSVPEPSSIGLLVVGLLALSSRRRAPTLASTKNDDIFV